ncbi:hypothetical protein CDAR_31631 [Caerostris darwini]|uniref:Uncharacterized protein n=1 Tax=Caerostris darwini TaxID=1538125 RepID=A0AAV4NUL1_9ARAC|nr:hypothetical protein CDAR_31631 [Caerostris darwini]
MNEVGGSLRSRRFPLSAFQLLFLSPRLNLRGRLHPVSRSSVSHLSISADLATAFCYCTDLGLCVGTSPDTWLWSRYLVHRYAIGREAAPARKTGGKNEKSSACHPEKGRQYHSKKTFHSSSDVLKVQRARLDPLKVKVPGHTHWVDR